MVAMDDEFETYYLVQHSQTGYVWVTYYATRSLPDARRRIDEDERGWYHHRVLDIRSKHVHRIRRPECD